MRMRVRAVKPTNQLALPLEVESPRVIRATQTRSFGADLEAVQRGSMPFATLAKKHKKLIAAAVRPWLSRCSANVGADDLTQELLLEVWRALTEWSPDYGVPLVKFVRVCMFNKLRGHTHMLVRKRLHDIRYMSQQIIEEKIVMLRYNRLGDGDCFFGYSKAAEFEAVCQPFDERNFDATRIAARIVGGLPSKQARVVAAVFVGESADVATRRVYGAKCKGQRKAALRAVAAAQALVQSS